MFELWQQFRCERYVELCTHVAKYSTRILQNDIDVRWLRFASYGNYRLRIFTTKQLDGWCNERNKTFTLCVVRILCCITMQCFHGKLNYQDSDSHYIISIIMNHMLGYLPWLNLKYKCSVLLFSVHLNLLKRHEPRTYRIIHGLPWINIFGSRVRRFANNFHEWRSHEWKSLANCITRDQNHYSQWRMYYSIFTRYLCH